MSTRPKLVGLPFSVIVLSLLFTSEQRPFSFETSISANFYFSTTGSCSKMLFMTQYSNPFPFRVTGGSLAITIPSEIVRDMGLVPGDTALFRREPDGLRLRIIRHS